MIFDHDMLVVCGPTGVGKTAFGIDLARRVGGRIVGADSMQIYRGMDIGTAKPTAEEQAAVVHYMVDIVDPDQPFDAAAYARRADDVVRQLKAEGIVPVVVGGTGLYIRALVYGLFDAPPADSALRRRLQAQLDQEGAAALHARLAALDPAAAERIHPNDAYRIVRALEVVTETGHPISEHHRRHGFRRPRYRVLTIGLELPREQLYARIDRRVDAMLAEGLLDEVRGLLARGYDPRLKSMQSLGYRHMVDYIQGRLDWEEAVRSLKRDHRRYAKRQITWFRADPEVRWVGPIGPSFKF
ncbi:tRNA (adenosine(37)-N6)-dimethylallyltransferase MiaA [Desulfatitalea alkaliphila]|uniref:tRNA dimethylallyltransferase n=1 Tax=Desulfatitalea alkaliphila TaxID=2929485 RepID=A0AA41UK92_9BACT|nr:tRNA (adenosine(37)-N6)-dimethylallyltransferase MiaA [Desulfatitalea alkaliphila]MCJ8502800.1 tRNA (adenosine(37)-N6)-dimethylallyltransferase MiaA [Desulfatitalea alkaliphila]